MIQWFQTFFKKEPEQIEEPSSPWDNFTFKIIHEIKYNRSPLTLYLDNDENPYASLILELDAQKQILVLDELFPQEGNMKVRSGQNIAIACRSNGISVKFDCRIKKVIDHHGIKGLLVEFPEDLDYMQRRETFRCKVPHAYPLIAQFILPNQPNFRATIEDISLTGMRLKVPHNITEHLSPRKQVDNCKIVQPNDQIIHCHFKICYYEYKPEYHGTLIGCEFKMLPPVEQREVNKLVTHLQRLERGRTSRAAPEPEQD